MTSANDPGHCRFLSSLGGIYQCADLVYREGFCRFHFEAFLKGEVQANGQIDERVSDQHRRRDINYHGLPPEAVSPAPDPTQR
ncbi:MAG TPA: hypothetical protein VGR67_06740 [Candidatus Polarisedimenticolia bacterium]|jgi:hypothetical protein|nr:hypothetical protein [Candidatus Polarisedimenticolia bacterium]